MTRKAARHSKKLPFEFNEDLHRKMFDEAIGMRRLVAAQLRALADLFETIPAQDVPEAVAPMLALTSGLKKGDEIPPQLVSSALGYLISGPDGVMMEYHQALLIEQLIQHQMDLAEHPADPAKAK
jgi:hypothetical protein